MHCVTIVFWCSGKDLVYTVNAGVSRLKSMQLSLLSYVDGVLGLGVPACSGYMQCVRRTMHIEFVHY